MTASYTHTWSTADTYGESDTIILKRGQAGYLQYGPFRGWSHGIATVYIPGSFDGPKPGVYSYPTQIHGDLPDRDDGTYGDVIHYARWMTKSEWEQKCGSAKPPAQVAGNTSQTSGVMRLGARSVG